MRPRASPFGHKKKRAEWTTPVPGKLGGGENKQKYSGCAGNKRSYS